MAQHEWEDLGWEKMATLLDEAQPLKPQTPRRWRWALLLLLLPMAYCGWQKGKITAKESIEGAEGLKKRPFASLIRTKMPDTEGGALQPASNQQILAPTQKGQQTVRDSLKQQLLVATPWSQAAVETKENIAALPLTDSLQDKKEAFATAVLPLLEPMAVAVSALETANISDLKTKKTLIPTPKPHRQWEAVADFLVNPGIKGGALSFQMVQPLSAQYHFTAGLGYRYLTFDQNSPQTWALNAQQDVGALSSNTSLGQGRAVVLQSLHYLDLPLSIRRHFGQKWSATLGVRPGLLLKAQAATTDTTGVWIANSGSNGFSKTTEWGMKKWDLALQTGIGWQFLPKHALHLQIDLSLVQATQPNSFLRLGYHFTIGKANKY